MVVGNPVLLTYKAQLSPNSRQPEMVEPLKKLLRQFLLQNNPEMYFNVATVLIYIFTCGNDMKGLRDITAGLSWRLEHISEELRSTLIILDMVRAIGEERFSAAASLSESIRYALLPEESRWMYLNLSCIIYYCLGKLEQAERCMNTALQLDNFRKIEPARGFNLLFLAITKCLKNDRGCLPDLIPEITVIGEKYNYDYLLANGRRLTAFERYLAHDAENAAEELDYAVYHYHLMGNTSMSAACRLLQRLWSIRPDGAGPDLAEARREMALINKAKPGLMVRESSLSVLGALAREAGDFQLAERSLLAAVRLARVKKSWQVLCGSCFHLARLYYAMQDTEKGSRYLRQAMELAAGGKHTMFWDIHIPTLTEMALRSIRADFGAGFAKELLGKYYDSGTVKYLAEKAKALEESRIYAFVNHFVSGCKAVRGEQLYIVKAALFGKPEISVNGVKIPESEWKTKKIKGLLEYLLLNSGKTVSKDALCEIFWPDADGKSAMASLRTALHQIRKTLAKYQAGVSGDSAFIHENLGGLQIKHDEFLVLDVAEFLRLHQELAALSKAAPDEHDRSMELLRQIVSLYRGDLMEGSDCGDLVFLERERCKVIFEDACLKLGSLYYEHGEAGQGEEILRRALALDPCSGNICLELLRLYILQGKRSKAVNLYYRFKKRYEQELDLKVDRRLKEVISKS